MPDDGSFHPALILLGTVLIVGVIQLIERGPALKYATSGQHRVALIVLISAATAGILVMAEGFYRSDARATTWGGATALIAGTLFVFFCWLGQRVLRHRSGSGPQSREGPEGR